MDVLRPLWDAEGETLLGNDGLIVGVMELEWLLEEDKVGETTVDAPMVPIISSLFSVD